MNSAVWVALLAEGVDRNLWQRAGSSPSKVALLAEGVDRNSCIRSGSDVGRVALLAEGVDRNSHRSRLWGATVQSPSSRRAWIEIFAVEIVQIPRLVALLAEGVDRNRLQP